jgi:hypothetical protein
MQAQGLKWEAMGLDIVFWFDLVGLSLSHSAPLYGDVDA